MLDRAVPYSRNTKIGGGVIVIVLTLFLCSRCTGASPDTATDPEPTATSATLDIAAPVPSEAPEETATRPAATETEAATAVPTELPTEVPASPEPPTAVPATAVPAYMSLDPLVDRDCDEFPSREAAQAYWDFHRTAERPNPGRLDGNANGVVCEDPDRAAQQAPAAQPVAPPAAGCVNFNTAGFDDLRRIKHVDDKIANEIIAERPFSGWKDLVDQINGIGDKNVLDIQAEGIGCF